MIFRTATNLTNSQPPRVLVRFSHSAPSVWGSTPLERAKAGHLRLQRCNSRWGRTEWCVKLPHQQLVDILPVPVKVHARRIALAAFWALACQSPSAEAQAPGVKAAGSLFLHTAAPTRVPHVAAGAGPCLRQPLNRREAWNKRVAGAAPLQGHHGSDTVVRACELARHPLISRSRLATDLPSLSLFSQR